MTGTESAILIKCSKLLPLLANMSCLKEIKTIDSGAKREYSFEGDNRPLGELLSRIVNPEIALDAPDPNKVKEIFNDHNLKLSPKGLFKFFDHLIRFEEQLPPFRSRLVPFLVKKGISQDEDTLRLFEDDNSINPNARKYSDLIGPDEKELLAFYKVGIAKEEIVREISDYINIIEYGSKEEKSSAYEGLTEYLDSDEILDLYRFLGYRRNSLEYQGLLEVMLDQSSGINAGGDSHPEHQPKNYFQAFGNQYQLGDE